MVLLGGGQSFQDRNSNVLSTFWNRNDMRTQQIPTLAKDNRAPPDAARDASVEERPFEKTECGPVPEESVQNVIQRTGLARQSVLDGGAYLSECETFFNDTHAIAIHSVPPGPHTPPLWHVLISRLDGKPIGVERYNLFMEIKESFFGPEHTGIEIYPPRSIEVDRANVYHIWVAKNEDDEFPRGFFEVRDRAFNDAKRRAAASLPPEKPVEPEAP